MAEIERQSTEIKIAVPWGHIAAKTYGSPTGKSVLMVHGRLDNAGSFTRLMKYLPKDYYYVCIDLPGHGLSSPFPSWQIIDNLFFVQVIPFVLDALQWKTCIYIGHSMGAEIAILFSILQPHRIEKIISLDGFAVISTKDNFITYFKETFEHSIKSSSNEESLLYTKEEILHALMYKRFSSLNSDAANAMFERAVTEVNGKYKYNRDIRLKRFIFILMSVDQFIQIAHEISVPVYIIAPSNGLITCNNIYNNIYHNVSKIIQSVIPKIPFEIVHVGGDHDIHNNNPEKVAPFICKFMNNDYSNKL